jgi:heme/copper-type cytochrome/quinol oxidase subunit 3
MALPAPFSSLANQASRVAQSAGRTAGVYVAIALVGMLGVGFLVAAAYIWLATLTDALIASLIMGGFFVAMAAIWLAVVMAKQKRIKEERRVTVANTAFLASSVSLADAGLRVLSRSKGPLFWPAAATLLATWYFTRGGGRDD